MKKLAFIFFLIFIFFGSAKLALAESMGFEGGISDKTQYKEVIFITGEPVVLSGDVKVSRSSQKNYTTERYTFSLTNKDKGAELKRSITLKIANTEQSGQVVSDITLDKYSETIKVGKDTYQLTDYQFSGSILTDKRPVIEYFSGNFNGRKLYSINKNGGTAEIMISGNTVGYRNYWSSTETRTADYLIRVTKGTSTWEGTYSVKTSFNNSKDLVYENNKPDIISFRGGYILLDKSEDLLEYSYDMPKMDSSGRIKGSDSFSLKTLPKETRLISPTVYDIGGHWAEQSIMKLYGLGAFEGQYFGPRLPIKRYEFAKAVAIASKIVDESLLQSKTKTTQEEPYFIDVPVTDPNYPYIKEMAKKGLIKGVAPNQFGPDAKLTRAQAITMLVRALGLEGIAPGMGYRTGFSDDDRIPSWARDSIYIASQIGLVKGDENGRVNPDEVLTRAEASVLLDRFISYLKSDLVKEYRERLLNY